SDGHPDDDLLQRRGRRRRCQEHPGQHDDLVRPARSERRGAGRWRLPGQLDGRSQYWRSRAAVRRGWPPDRLRALCGERSSEVGQPQGRGAHRWSHRFVDHFNGNWDITTSIFTVDTRSDFNANGLSDILWQGSDGTPALWLMNGTTAVSAGAAGAFNP